MYRVPDEPPGGRGELQSLLEVLAAPLAVLRQSIQELHADLFIDTADDRIVPYLAEMVGTELVFPDAESNRRDVRGTVGWRRRKGTPAALEEMGGELTGQSVVLQEGWKRIQLAQDLNLVRAERVVVDLRPGVVAEQATGPLDALFHAVDVRAHLGHDRAPPPAPRRALAAPDDHLPAARGDRRRPHAPGLGRALRDRSARRAPAAARAADRRRPRAVRRPHPGAALRRRRPSAGSAGPAASRCASAACRAGSPGRRTPSASRPCASPAGSSAAATSTLTALEQPSRGWRGAVRVELGLRDDLRRGHRHLAAATRATFAVRARHRPRRGRRRRLGDGGRRRARRHPRRRCCGSPRSAARPGASSPARRSSSRARRPGSTAAVEDARARARGVPARRAARRRSRRCEIRGERLLHVAADGSLYEAADAGGALIEHARGRRRAAARAGGAARRRARARRGRRCRAEAEPRMLEPRPGRTRPRARPCMHGALPLRRHRRRLRRAPGRRRAARWPSPSRSRARRAGVPAVPAPGLDRPRPALGDLDGARRRRAAGRRRRRRRRVRRGRRAARSRSRQRRARRAVRVLGSRSDALPRRGRLERRRRAHGPHPPAPARRRAASTGAPWPTEATFGFASEAVRVGEDGSTWASESTAGRRVSLGEVAPIAEAAGLRRRARARAPAVRVGSRGLDRIAAGDARADAARPARRRRPARAVRVLRRRAAAGLARRAPTARSRRTSPPTTRRARRCTSARAPPRASRCSTCAWRRPTRLVSRSGTLHPDAPADWHTIPRYDSLAAALAAVSASWQAIPATDDGDVSEVVQFEDSATYPDEAPVWPAAPANAAVSRIADDPGRRARAPDDPRRSRPGLADSGARRAVRSADAARHRPRRQRLDRNDAAGRRGGRSSSSAASCTPRTGSSSPSCRPAPR